MPNDLPLHNKSTWGRFDVQWFHQQSVVMLPPALRADAWYLHMGMTGWSRNNANLTDGEVPRAIIPMILAGTPMNEEDVLSALAGVGLVSYDAETVTLLDYWDWQETRAEVEARIGRNSRNGSKGGRPKKSTPTETQSVNESLSKSVTKSLSESKSSVVKSSAVQLSEEQTGTDSMNIPAPNGSDNAVAAAALVESLWNDHAKQERAERGLPVLTKSQGESLVTAVAEMLADASLPQWAVREAVDGALRAGKSPAAYATDVATKKAQEAAGGPSVPAPSKAAPGLAAVPSLPGVSRAPSRIQTA